MTSISIEALLAKRRNLLGEISRLQSELSEVDTSISERLQLLHQAFAGQFSGTSTPPSLAAENAGGNESPPKRRAKRGTIKPHVLEILSISSKSLSTREVFDELQRRGVMINSEKPLNTISAMLSHADEVQRGPDNVGWQLRRSGHETQTSFHSSGRSYPSPAPSPVNPFVTRVIKPN